MKNVFEVEVNGEGADGMIKLSEEQIDFKTVKISENKKIGVRIKNASECAFYLDITLKNACSGLEHKVSESQISNAFKLDYKNGVIPGNSEIDLGITFSPLEVVNFDLLLVVNARERVPKKIQTMKSKGIEPVLKSEMRVKAIISSLCSTLFSSCSR